MTLNPWRLRLLSQLDALGTVRAVAQAANLSASSVSQQLAVLESETRTQLIERTGRRVRLTSAGLILARRARSILDQMDAVEAELRGLNDEPSGLIRLGAFQSSIHTLAVPAIQALRHPHLDVEIVELEPHASMPALLAGEVDVIITTTDFVELPVPGDIDVVPLGQDPIVLVTPPNHPAADIAACKDEPWAFDIPGSYMAKLATRLCRQSGFEPRVVGRFSNYMLTLKHVEAGLAVAVLPALAVDRRFDVVTRELPVTRRITAAVRRDSRAAITVVLDALHARSQSDER
ncbi:DNA-binding transcriptional regulator, LysR family [Lentzea albidocapillata subsp. violacea]|uniref:DNA-binding transcriptional regulator, LysR family n=1 Tax=Lentzea albidocapillata subsp. violacea TaxID=128104 RepID=A0A1G8R6P7_9PSEU|nr:LysR substrate-binding domain-containing protein [Lentzea albidocapillata]SDJ12641.1 DNA-binding transcriptional regulator, LysR family [Lentzea albidocapillata subsp. violacea]